jgi:phage host-nuclease inhibitor protein Gam
MTMAINYDVEYPKLQRRIAELEAELHEFKASGRAVDIVKIQKLKAKLATLQGGLQSICDTHGYAVPKPVLNNLLAALEDEKDE